MASTRLGTALRQIQRLFVDGTGVGLTDAQLWERFATERDADAFAAARGTARALSTRRLPRRSE